MVDTKLVEAAMVVLLLAATPSGCASSSSGNAVPPLVRRAMFDLSCPREQLHWQSLGNETWGVTGCNEKATYHRVCQDRRSLDEHCFWVRN